MNNKKKKQKTKAGIRTNPLCEGCPALCCHHLVMPMDKPRNRDEVNNFKWHLMYDTTSLFIRNRRWYLQVEGKCLYLDKRNLCVIYDRRPDKCRRHNPPGCEYYLEHYDAILHTPEELEEYLKKKRTS